MAKRTRGSKSKVKVDLSGVESRKVPEEGIYNVKVESVEETESNNSGKPLLKWVFVITDGEFKGMKLFENTSLQPQALFKLKNVLEGLGVDIPNKAFDIDLSEMIGLTASVDVVNEKFEGNKKAVIAEYIVDGDEDEEDSDVEELIEDLEEDELRELAIELGMSKKKAKKADEDDLVEYIEEQDYDEVEEAMDELFDDEDEDEDDEPDYESMSLKELKSAAKEAGIKVKKSWDKEDIIEALEDEE